MTRTAPPPVSPEVLANWRRRLAALHAQLDGHRSDEWAWLWQIRIDVINHLLTRYTGRPPELSPEPAAPGPGPEPESPEPYGRRALPPPPWVPEGMGKPIRPPAELRPRLQSLAEANRGRRALLQQFRDAWVAQDQVMQALFDQERKRQFGDRWPPSTDLTTPGQSPPPPDPRRAEWEARWQAQEEGRRQYLQALTATLTDEQLQSIAAPTLSDDEVLAILNQ